MKKPKYILDSYALLAYFQAEPAGVEVPNILKDASSNYVAAFLSVISLGEIYLHYSPQNRGRESRRKRKRYILFAYRTD